MSRVRLLALLGIVPLVLLAACPDGEPDAATGDASSTGGTSGGSGMGGSAGTDAGLVWDPVWHETKPNDWAPVSATDLPDCGEGCRLALNVPLRNRATFGHQYTGERVLSMAKEGLVFADLGSSVTLNFPHPADAARLDPSVWGDFVSYQRAFGTADGQVEVANLVTGETKLAFRYTPDKLMNSVERTVMGPNHVYWVYTGGLWARNLQTGEVKNLTGFCWTYCAIDNAIVCDAGRIKRIDALTGEHTFIDNGGAWQTHGTCSPGRAKYVWVDYRDPPGPGSTEFGRSGGEIYVHDLSTKTTKRVTFDSPGAPRGKVYPAVDGDLIVWNEPGIGDPADPNTLTKLHVASNWIAKFDMKTGKRCQMTSRKFYVAFKSLHGTHLYGTWFDSSKPGGDTWLIDLDLEHPSLKWDCVDTPQWKP